jgi:hypothetical protein
MRKFMRNTGKGDQKFNFFSGCCSGRDRRLVQNFILAAELLKAVLTPVVSKNLVNGRVSPQAVSR